MTIYFDSELSKFLSVANIAYNNFSCPSRLSLDEENNLIFYFISSTEEVIKQLLK